MFDLMEKYMLIPAPSGYEGEMARALKGDLQKYCDEVTIDLAGNVIGRLAGSDGGRRLMVFAHMDSLGFIVRRIEADGYLRVDRLGGVPEKVLPGLKLLVRTEEGRWLPGVFGPKAHHATPAEEKYKVEQVTELFVDIGAENADEARAAGVEIGCPAVYQPSFTRLMGSKVAGTAVDNRASCAALVEVARLLSAERPKWDVYLVGTVWEEFNLRGGMLAARTVKPDAAISMDVTLAGDTHDLKGRFEDALGGGPCVQLYSFHGRGTLNGTLPHEPLFKLVKRAAREAGLPLQRFAALGMLTDSAYVQLEGPGVAALETGFPARYTHTPVEVCDARDAEALARLIAASARLLDGDFQLARY